MNLIAQTQYPGKKGTQNAFTLVEVLMAASLAGIVFMTAIAGFSNAFSTLQLDRENCRATQILLEKTEMLRVYNWDQIIGRDTNTYVPTNFTAPFYPDNSNGGFSYTGTVSISNLVTTASYSNDIRSVTITLTWTSGKAQRSRSMTTYVSEYGLADYIY